MIYTYTVQELNLLRCFLLREGVASFASAVHMRPASAALVTVARGECGRQAGVGFVLDFFTDELFNQILFSKEKKNPKCYKYRGRSHVKRTTKCARK